MSDRPADALTSSERSTVRSVLAYQFDVEVGHRLLDSVEITKVTRSRSGRLDRIYVEKGRVGTLTTHGRFTLGLAGGFALHSITDPPAHRVIIDDEAIPFVAEEKNAFAKFVVSVDPLIRPNDEVLIVDREDELIAVGRAELSAAGMSAFDRGMAVSVRRGVGPIEDD